MKAATSEHCRLWVGLSIWSSTRPSTQVSSESFVFTRNTHNLGSQNVGQVGRLVNIHAHDEIRLMNRNLVLLPTPLPPRLLPDDPNSRPVLAHVRRRVNDDILQAGHGLESRLEKLARCDVLEHLRVRHGLAVNNGIVGGAVEEGAAGEVEEDVVVVDPAADFGEVGLGGPDFLVVGLGHVGGGWVEEREELWLSWRFAMAVGAWSFNGARWVT